ncbi:MAG: ankyrin repeat domain-containing protein [Deltaproteobacteria bacterium]|nr:ankyrin repeat domain-containing protein [Deltaproteobacteria bacterium]
MAPPICVQGAIGQIAEAEKGVHAYPPEVDARTERGDTPLLCAAASRSPGTLEVLGVLLDQGAAPDATAAVEGRCALHALAVQGHTQSMALLLRAGATAQVATSRFGSTPLHHAVEGGHSGAVALWLNAGVDPAHREQLGRRALDIARKGGKLELVALLEGATS